jgi:hypothetical protein
MFSIIDQEAATLSALEQRLRRRRLSAGEPQTRAACRIGVSVRQRAVLPIQRMLDFAREHRIGARRDGD